MGFQYWVLKGESFGCDVYKRSQDNRLEIEGKGVEEEFLSVFLIENWRVKSPMFDRDNQAQ